jgi:hypothetical protein
MDDELAKYLAGLEAAIDSLNARIVSLERDLAQIRSGPDPLGRDRDAWLEKIRERAGDTR